MRKQEHKVVATDRQIDAALVRAKKLEPFDRRVLNARYDPARDKVVLQLPAGLEVSIPRSSLQGLRDASPPDVSVIHVVEEGTILHWPTLDVDHYVLGLLDGVFGTRSWMTELGRLGGSSRSEAKRAAARENGRKGGRPPTKARKAVQVPNAAPSARVGVVFNPGSAGPIWKSGQGSSTQPRTPGSNTPQSRIEINAA